MAEVSTLIAWCEMKAAACDQEVEMAKLVGMERVAEPFARDAKFYRAIVAALSNGTKQAVADGAIDALE